MMSYPQVRGTPLGTRRTLSTPSSAPRNATPVASVASRRHLPYTSSVSQRRSMRPNSSHRGSSSRSHTATPASGSRIYRSSPPLLARAHRPQLSSRLPAGGFSSGNGSSESEPTERAHDDISEAEMDLMNEVIMSVDMRDHGSQSSTMGCAYYVTREQTLYLLEDVPMANADLVETLLLHAQPTTVLISSRAPESLAQVLERGSQDINGNRGDFPGAYILRTLNSTDFRYEPGKNRLRDLHLGMDGPQSMLYTSVVDDTSLETDDLENQGSNQGHLMRLATSVNLDSRFTIGCAGAVLGDLQRRKTTQYLPNDPEALDPFGVQSVKMFSLFNSMFVNADTFASLQILQSEFHPNSHQRGPTASVSGAKESLSVYGLFCHLAVTPQGKLKLRRMFLQPSTDIDLIRERLRTIAFFTRPGHADTLVSLSKSLRGIKDMKSVLLLLRQGIDNPGRKISVANSVWAVIQKFAAYTLQLRESLRALPDGEKIGIVRKVVQTVDVVSVHQAGELIAETIDFEQSVDRGRTAVNQGVDAELDERKRSYDGMEHLLASVIGRLRSDLPEWAQKYVQNCIFFPQLGFLTVVSINPDTGKVDYDGEGSNDRWERMFVTEDGAYYKNRKMKDMDDEFGDTYCMIIDREIEIIHELSTRILEREAAIIAASEVLGELDSLLALAIVCGQNKWTAPEMTGANILHIKGGRHPLQELVTPSFIANDCLMSGGPAGDVLPEASESTHSDSPSTVILTGPNHSGKSVYLKQVAIIVYLAHIGCFVPAERAVIGITDRILTRVATRESVARSESAFAIDLRQVAFAMNFATRRSLILIDEFGKGTNNNDGAGLMKATIDHFTGLGPERPKLLVATHFHEILEDNFLVESAELAFAHMEIHIDLDAAAMEDQVTYLYQLMAGRSISSFGSRCAAMNGVDQAIVERAESIILQMVRHEDLEVSCSKLSDEETQKLTEAETVARAFLEEDFALPPAPLPKEEAARWYHDKLDKILSIDLEGRREDLYER
ncbi:muts domain V-domain-containing protein [Poronia punctata]|nr:muts domain V-domain-containing protein [Poronia punctata]